MSHACAYIASTSDARFRWLRVFRKKTGVEQLPQQQQHHAAARVTGFYFVRRFLPLYILVFLDSSVDDRLVSATVC